MHRTDCLLLENRPLNPAPQQKTAFSIRTSETPSPRGPAAMGSSPAMAATVGPGLLFCFFLFSFDERLQSEVETGSTSPQSVSANHVSRWSNTDSNTAQLHNSVFYYVNNNIWIYKIKLPKVKLCLKVWQIIK